MWLLIRADAGGLTGNEWGSLDSTLFLAQRGINPSPRCFTGMKLQLPSKVNGDWRCCSSKVGGGNNPRWCDVWRSCYMWSDWFASHDDVASCTIWTHSWPFDSNKNPVSLKSSIVCDLTIIKKQNKVPPEGPLGGNVFIVCSPTSATQHPQRYVVTQQLHSCTSFDSAYTCMPG